MQTSAFDDSAATALDAMYEQFGITASYLPDGGSAVGVQVLVDERTRTVNDRSGARSKVHSLRGSVRVSEVNEMGRGDTIQLTDDPIVFKVIPSSVSNDGLEWDFEAHGEVVTTFGDVKTVPNR